MTNKLTIPHSIIQQAVKIALYEDLAGHHDLTSSLIPESKPANAYIITRKNMVLCGQAWVNEVLRQIDETIIIDWKFNDGDISFREFCSSIVNSNLLKISFEGVLSILICSDQLQKKYKF